MRPRAARHHTALIKPAKRSMRRHTAAGHAPLKRSKATSPLRRYSLAEEMLAHLPCSQMSSTRQPLDSKRLAPPLRKLWVDSGSSGNDFISATTRGCYAAPFIGNASTGSLDCGTSFASNYTKLYDGTSSAPTIHSFSVGSVGGGGRILFFI